MLAANSVPLKRGVDGLGGRFGCSSGRDSNWGERRCRGIVTSLLALLVSAHADAVRFNDGNLLFFQQRLLLFQSAGVYLCLESFGGLATDLHRREGEGGGSHLGCSGEGRHMLSAAMTTMLALKGGALKNSAVDATCGYLNNVLIAIQSYNQTTKQEQ
jgi:hypothetical protein